MTALLVAGALGSGLAGCAAEPVAGAVPESSLVPTPSSTPAPATPRQAAVMPESCPDLIGENLDLLMEARELTLRPTGDTIQGRFSGIRYSGDGEPRAMSCAYASDDEDDDGRYEFGVAMLTAADRDVVLGALRAGPGANTTGLSEETVGDALQFTQTGAPDSDSVPDDWALVFTVFPDAWTMVWSPDGGADVLDQHIEWADQLEESVYPAS